MEAVGAADVELLTVWSAAVLEATEEDDPRVVDRVELPVEMSYREAVDIDNDAEEEASVRLFDIWFENILEAAVEDQPVVVDSIELLVEVLY